MSGGATGWGWYRLSDEWAARLVAAARVRAGQPVVELGAGDGALTVALATAGARVIAVELHPGRAERLRRRVAGLDVAVVEADIADFRYPRRPVRVVANPPFATVSRLLHDAVAAPGVTAVDVVLPVTVARRWAEGRNKPRRFDATFGPRVPRRAFTPAPRVDCVLLQLRRRYGPADHRY